MSSAALPKLPALVAKQFGLSDNVANRQLLLDIARGGITRINLAVPQTADDYNGATVKIVKLPDHFKAFHVKACYVRTVSSGSVLGALTDKGDQVTPTTGTFSRSACGDIQLLAADNATLIDVEFQSSQYDVVEYGGADPSKLALPVDHSTGLVTLPAAVTDLGVLMLLEAELLTVGAGGVAGKKIVLAEGTAPATTKANLNVARTGVYFQPTDVGATDGTARVKLAVGRPQA